MPLDNNENQEITSKTIAIQKAINLLAARRRYHESLIEMANNATNQDIDAYFSEHAPTPTLRLGKIDLFRKDTDRKHLIRSSSKYVIESLDTMLDLLSSSVEDNNKVLDFVYHLNSLVRDYTRRFESLMKPLDSFLAHLTTQKKEIEKELKRKPNKQELIQSLGDYEHDCREIIFNQNIIQSMSEDIQEIAAYNYVKQILKDAKIITKVELDLEKYYTYIDHVSHAEITETPKFDATKKHNQELFSKLTKKIEEHKCFRSKINSISINLEYREAELYPWYLQLQNEFNKYFIKKNMPPLDNFRYHRCFEDFIKPYIVMVENEFSEDRAWVAKQEEILAQEKVERNKQLKLLKQTALAERSAINKQKANEQIQLAALKIAGETERKQISQLEQQQLEEAKQKQAARNAERKLLIIQKRQTKEQEKFAKEKEKMQRHQLEVIAAKSLIMDVTDVGNENVSNIFKVPQSIVDDNHKEISHLFDRSTKTYDYNSALTLIKRLGGMVVETKGGSSHKAIEFNGIIFSCICVSDNIEAKSQKFGLAKPHTPELRHNNLELLRQAIFAILPNDCSLTQEWGPRASRHKAKFLHS